MSEGALPAVCRSCWSKFLGFRRVLEKQTTPEADFNRWLARKVFLDLKRLKKTGVIGQCEAVSDWLYGNRGYQCGLVATEMRDGHRVCGVHVGATNPAYVGGDASNDPYQVLTEIMRSIARVDERFAQALAQAGEAGTAETRRGSVHEHAVPEGDAP